MQRLSKLAFAAVVAAALSAAPVLADAPSSSTTFDGSPAPSFSRFGWGGIGIGGSRYTFDDGFGFSASSTDTTFDINLGVAVGFLPITSGLSLDVWGSLSANIGSYVYFPISVGVGVVYDRLPIQLFGGLGFSLVPNTVPSELVGTAVGADIILMGIYPLPKVLPHLGGYAQLQFDILDDHLFIWSLSLGAAYQF